MGNFKPRKQKFIWIVKILMILCISIVYATNSYRADISQTVTVDEHGTCRIVINNGANDIFIPTKTSLEWSTFRSNLPSGVTLDDCCVPDMGQSCGGNDCVNPGTIQCDGSCVGESNKPDGTGCSDDGNSCTNDYCSSGNCIHPAYCSGSDTNCGCTSCSNCNSNDGCSGTTYYDYYCSGTGCTYTTIGCDSRCYYCGDGSCNCGESGGSCPQDCCVSNYGQSCGGNDCVNPGTIQCDGSCSTTNKAAGTGCGSCNMCDGNGNCVCTPKCCATSYTNGYTCSGGTAGGSDWMPIQDWESCRRYCNQFATANCVEQVWNDPWAYQGTPCRCWTGGVFTYNKYTGGGPSRAAACCGGTCVPVPTCCETSYTDGYTCYGGTAGGSTWMPIQDWESCRRYCNQFATANCVEQVWNDPWAYMNAPCRCWNGDIRPYNKYTGGGPSRAAACYH